MIRRSIRLDGKKKKSPAQGINHVISVNTLFFVSTETRPCPYTSRRAVRYQWRLPSRHRGIHLPRQGLSQQPETLRRKMRGTGSWLKPSWKPALTHSWKPVGYVNWINAPRAVSTSKTIVWTEMWLGTKQNVTVEAHSFFLFTVSLSK